MITFEKRAQRIIDEAIVRGDFDNLPGKGKPLDLQAYFAMPEHLRIGYDLLKKAGILPEEMELKQKLELCREKLSHTQDGNEKTKLVKELNYLEMKYAICTERMKKNVF